MRMMLKVTVPVESGNKTIADGALPRVIQETVERIKPEAAYFTAAEGARTGLFFFDLADSSQIPSICEPLFSVLNAAIDIRPSNTPVMVWPGSASRAARRQSAQQRRQGRDRFRH